MSFDLLSGLKGCAVPWARGIFDVLLVWGPGVRLLKLCLSCDSLSREASQIAPTWPEELLLGLCCSSRGHLWGLNVEMVRRYPNKSSRHCSRW